MITIKGQNVLLQKLPELMLF